jgi:acetylornithine deacetylase/succinyl-diaminopimelate desuccinylase-like protein
MAACPPTKKPATFAPARDPHDRGNQRHRADERMPRSDLYKAAEVVALTLMEVLGA